MTRPFLARLGNGVRVVAVPRPTLSRAHVFVQLRGGPAHEDDDTWGLSHLTEHMLFRGAGRFADVRALTLFADDFGGDVGAMTYRDRVAYDTRVDPDRLGDAFSLLAGMMTAPRFTGLAIERDIVEEEIADLFDDDGNEVDVENAVAVRILAGHPLARSIEGTPASLRKATRARLRQFHARCYRGGNLVVSVAGPVARRAVLEAAGRAFARVQPGGPPAPGVPPRPPRRRDVTVIPTDASQTQLRLCAPAPGVRSKDAWAAVALARVLDDGPASRLQARVVDAQGLAYAVWAFADQYEERGVLEVGGTVRHDRVEELARELLRQLLSLARRGPTAAELARVVQRYRRDARDAWDDPAALAEAAGKGTLFSQPWSPEHAVAALAAVRPDDVRSVARSCFARAHVVLAGSPSRRAVQAARATVARLAAAR
ncbi:MAG: insulinase family protein [Deltaproteobacteria bacterium]|nr:insulinase family protein [Deltaproteobacteria bacterium]